MKIYFWNEGNTKIFSDEGKLREFTTRIITPKEMLKEILQMKNDTRGKLGKLGIEKEQQKL